MSSLTPLQQAAIGSDGTVFIYGRAGTGKTTVLRERLGQLLSAGNPAYTVLVLVADPEQRNAFSKFIEQSDLKSFSDLKLMHFNQLAREMVMLFWPLVARQAGFASGFKPPTFLGYDLAQLLMWNTITPMVDRGAFADLRRRPQQIVSQLLDTLNRSALNRLDILQATERQVRSWAGEANHVRNLHQAKEAADTFRQHCLDNNLLDLSLTIDVFNNQVLAHPEFSRYFSERYQHILVDNVEEQTPAGQHFVAGLMQSTESATIVYDADGGYRRFLAADPLGAQQFRLHATRVFDFEEGFAGSKKLRRTARMLDDIFNGRSSQEKPELPEGVVLDIVQSRYRREMLNTLAARLATMLKEDPDLRPSDIAIMVPYLDGALRYTLIQALRDANIPMNIVRRRASPREEPRVRAWLTWVALAHPNWGVLPTEYDVSEALALSIQGLDPARAALLAGAAYPPSSGVLRSAENLPPDLTERLSPEIIELYEKLRLWINDNGGQHPLDQFIYRLFTDLLARRDFQPEPDLAAAGVIEWLVKTATRLVEASGALGLKDSAEIGRAFLTCINKGLVTSEPPEMGDPPDPDGILISTIYGYLLRGQPVRMQVWLETSASGWWDIPRQPLSNAFVLAPSWDADRQWTLSEEINIRNQLLTRIVYGLTARATDGIILATSALDRRGQRQDGPLWRAFELLQPDRIGIDDGSVEF
ncbi:MAG: UvrD-helicase domain-containing protein [Candidatus Promineifilaceae bacterium]